MNNKLSVITLNYKNVELTKKCVQKVYESVAKKVIGLEIIVVDNSTDETAHQLKNILQEGVKIIETEKNLGFAKANNLGIINCSGNFILLLNNDVFVNKESIETGINYLLENPKTAIWAPRLVSTDGKAQTSCAKFPSIKGAIGEYLFGKQWDWYKDMKNWSNPKKVDTVIGAFMLITNKVIKKVGLLNEHYFFNMEDMEFCMRVHQNNMDVVFDPRCEVIHLGGASQSYKWVNDPHLHKNRILYFKKNKVWIAAAFTSLIINTGLLLRKLKNII